MRGYTIECGDGGPTLIIGEVFQQRFRLTPGWLLGFGSGLSQSIVWLAAEGDDGQDEWRARQHGDTLRLIRRDLTVYDYNLRHCSVTEFVDDGNGVMSAREIGLR